jgi:hypothetical protein
VGADERLLPTLGRRHLAVELVGRLVYRTTTPLTSTSAGALIYK